jgi:hypothetical protein
MVSANEREREAKEMAVERMNFSSLAVHTHEIRHLRITNATQHEC